MSSASRGSAPREGLECLLVEMGRTGPLAEPRHGLQAGKSGDPVPRTPTLCHCGDPLIYKRRPMVLVGRVRKLMNPSRRTRIVTAAPGRTLSGKCTTITTIIPPSIHQSRSRVLRLAAAQTWVNCLCALCRAAVH